MTYRAFSVSLLRCFPVLVLSGVAVAQAPQFVVRPFAGSFPLGDGGPATAALLDSPTAVVVSGGNIYILDANHYRIRRVTAAGTISTFASLSYYGHDMKLGADGNLYVAAFAAVLKVTPAGVVSRIAGTAGPTGYSGDGGPATSAQVSLVSGIALDSANNVYITDNYNGQSRVRMITAASGEISTLAGTGATTFNGDARPATSANLFNASGVAVDSRGAIYVADQYHYRIRKFTSGGTISTVAGSGVFGTPVDGSATASPLGNIEGLSIDSQDNLYAADSSGYVLRISAAGSLARIAGGGATPNTPGADEPAVLGNLLSPTNASPSPDGGVYVTDSTHLVRHITGDGRLTVLAGKLHFGGDGGPATSALFNRPADIVMDGQGNMYVADAENYRIRKIAPDGTISTVAGNGRPWTTGSKNQLPSITAMTIDAAGTLYVAGIQRVFSVTSDGTVTHVAGIGFYNPDLRWDGSGPALQAPFGWLTGIAVDKAGNIYVSDRNYRQVRKISSDRTTSIVAGNGTGGYSGDGGLATSARFASPSRLAFDSQGNLYIADEGNYAVRRVSPTGIISTVLGNGTFGRPVSGASARGPFSTPAGIAFDVADNMFVSSQNYGDLYRVAQDGSVLRIVGNGNVAPSDGALASQAYFFNWSLQLDAAGDVYSLSRGEYLIRKLVLNTPSALTITDGDKQTAEAGKPLARALRVRVTGRAGVGIGGMSVAFAVKSGVATLSAASSATDATGVAGVAVTLGSTAGDVQITASVPGTPLAAVTFTVTAMIGAPACATPKPVVTSATTAGDFGGSPTVAAGSWIEIKGTSLASKARQWDGADFTGSNAPTTLDGVSVTIGGQSAFVSYISPGQINVQVPGGVEAGDVPLAVSTSTCSVSDSRTIRMAPAAPGLLAPSAFRVNGRQYVASTFPDGVFVGRANLITGAAFRPAVPGDTVTMYGVGFGPVTPNVAPGVIVGADNALPNVAILIDSTPATVKFAGLAPGVIGLYQFNLVIPQLAAGDHTVSVQANSVRSQDGVYLTTGVQ